jgi:arsenical pump membrane protein
VSTAGALQGSLGQVWQPFTLIAGLLLIGRTAASDGLFEAVGARLARILSNGVALFASLMLLVAVVTAVLNLDTSVVFLTPVLIHAARQRGIKEDAFLYGAIFMSNGASLLLPGSNLTNILVLSTSPMAPSGFALRMLVPWVASIAVITALVALWRWRDLRGPLSDTPESPPLRWGLGVAGIALATAFVLTLTKPALPILITGVVLVTTQVTLTGRLTRRQARHSLQVTTLLTLFLVAVGFGFVARVWSGPAHLMNNVGPWASAGIGAGLSGVVNNLPAAVLLSSQPLHQPLALLVGLDLGPNLVIFGAMSSLLWLRIARAEGARPSVARFTRLGIVITPCSMVVALVALRYFAPHSF